MYNANMKTLSWNQAKFGKKPQSLHKVKEKYEIAITLLLTKTAGEYDKQIGASGKTLQAQKYIQQ